MPDGEIKPAASQAPTQSAASNSTAAFGRGFLYDLWYFAALSGELKPGKLKRYEMLGEPVLIGRTQAGQAYALRDICPHRAAPLSAGALVKDDQGQPAVQCVYHGWLFRTADGVCSSIPSLVEGQGLDSERIRVRAYPIRESQGLVFVYMGSDPRSAEIAAEPPKFAGVVGGGPKLVERMDFDSHVDQAVVGLMDPTHGPFVHQQWWWRSSKKQLVKAKAFEPRELGFSMISHAPSKNSRAYRILGGAPVTEITFRLPGYRWEHIRVGKRQVLALTCLTPITETKTRITQIIWSDHWAFGVLKPLIRAGTRIFLKQDGDMVNLQNEGLRFDPALIWIDDADKQAKWYQQLKKAWVAHRGTGAAFVNPVAATILRWRS
jgi:phenylpropionate dioxygenase-like ring-hydroxylating dioxygenase large terminal subunit